MTEMTHIPLNELTVSRDNVRVVSTDKAADKQLMASIRAQGVLQNLIVVADEHGYTVIGGGRRLAALQALQGDGEIAADYPVPCTVKDPQSAVAASLAENVARRDMHPADEFMAYKTLADQGRAVKEIAREFGTSQARVKRLLKLAGVAPQLVEKFRAGELDLEDVMAFTVSEDHERQMATYRELAPGRLMPHMIRRMLLDQAVSSSDRRARFVGVQAYRAAGGEVSRDLFAEETYLHDPELLRRLARERLEAEAEQWREAGWKWVEVDLDRPFIGFGDYAGRLQGELQDVPPELTEALRDARSELEQLEEKDFDERTDLDLNRETELDEKIEELEEQLEEYRAFTDEQKAQARVVVHLSFDGEMRVEPGYLRNEDVKAVTRGEDNAAGVEGVTAATDDGHPESQALRTDLRNYRLQALQAELAQHPELAYDLTVFQLAEQVLADAWPWTLPLDLRIQPADFSQTRDMDEKRAAEVLAAVRDGLDVSWMVYDERGPRFSAFRELGANAKARLLAFAVACAFQDGSTGLTALVSQQMDFNLADYWTPGKDDYFARLKKADLLQLAEDQIGADWAHDNRNRAKEDLANEVADVDEMRGWLPEILR